VLEGGDSVDVARECIVVGIMTGGCAGQPRMRPTSYKGSLPCSTPHPVKFHASRQVHPYFDITQACFLAFGPSPCRPASMHELASHCSTSVNKSGKLRQGTTMNHSISAAGEAISTPSRAIFHQHSQSCTPALHERIVLHNVMVYRTTLS
jgi:hypothetical protein